METACEASLSLNRPPRFRHVCPLLQQRADGRWVCSVDTPDVRPFWVRAFAIFAGTGLAIYLVGTIAVFGLLRFRAYPIRYYEVAWPPAWSHFHEIQSRYFTEKANRALAHRDIGEAVMALSIAYQLNPKNFGLGSTLAQLTAIGEPALSDNVYGQLVRDHPDRVLEIFPRWYESLLWRGDFPAIQSLARDALIADPGHQSAWLYAEIFALRRFPNHAWLEKLATDPKLAASRAVFELELQTEAAGPSARAALLRKPISGAPDFLNFYRPKRLIELGFADDALSLLSATNSLEVHDLLALRLEAYGAKGWDTLLRNEALAQFPVNNSGLIDAVAAQLIRQPNPVTFPVAFDALEQLPAGSPDSDYQRWASWLCAAGANQDFGRFERAKERMQRISKNELRALSSLEAFFRGESASHRLESYLPEVQPLPLDVTYALLERYHHPLPTGR